MTNSGDLICGDCGQPFALSAALEAKYPGWRPKQCMSCRTGKRVTRAATKDERLTRAQVLERHSAGPTTGIFTDGHCEPNPGRGGWGAVKVVNDAIVEERSGHAPHTTNNRMELQALIGGYQMLARDEAATLYSDSNLCVRTVNDWAASWERRGWKKRTGEIANLDLVQELYALAVARPNARLEWIRAHAGSRWNEYADALARSHYDEPESRPA
jgi:ribonuclease HI